jgi:hypothetical protein
MQRFLIISVLVILAIPAFALANMDNLIINGGFEEPLVPNVPPYYVHLNESGLPGWNWNTIFKGTVLFLSPLYDPVSEGTQAVQIEVGGEWISQSLATISGQSYELSFDLTAYSGYGPHEAYLKVTVGSVSEPDLVSSDLVGDSQEGYVRHTFNFTANSTEMTLTFLNSAEHGAWWNYPQIDNVVVNVVRTTIAIDIKPGSSPNSINRKSKGKIPVAILSTEDFYAPDMVDQGSLTFGHTGNEQSLAFCNIRSEDVNGDGLGDLMCHFFTQLTEFNIDDMEGILKGKTINGIPIIGRDTVNIVR